jgi:hypothetical protein
VSPQPRFPTKTKRPGIVRWSRLEPRTRTDDLPRALRAEVRDGLWMLARQWQVGEFAAEDAGSPVLARAVVDTSPLTQVVRGDADPEPYAAGSPLEPYVEAEPVEIDLPAALAIGRRFVQLLGPTLAARYRDLFAAAYPIAPVERAAVDADVLGDPLAHAWRLAAAGRGIDGGALLADQRAGRPIEGVTAGGRSVEDADRAGVAAAAAELAAGFGLTLEDPPGEAPQAWRPQELTHGFSCAFGGKDAAVRLTARDFDGGEVDWYTLDLEPDVPERPPADRQVVAVVPAQVSFAGMPRPRWWEFEDPVTDFGSVSAGTTDLALLLVLEMALVYSNDWGVIPYAAPAGSFTAVRAIVVTNSFGEHSLVEPTAPAAGSDPWTMFTHAGAASREGLFLPPPSAGIVDGQPVESVAFLRDEAANLAWAVETRVPSPLGRAVPGDEAARARLGALVDLAGAAGEEDEAGRPALRYRVAAAVPENWIPLVPVRPGGPDRLRLQRGAMPRLVAGLPPEPVRPRGRILNPPGMPGGYTILPAELGPGATVSRRARRARRADGTPVTWYGRRRTDGATQASSGLTFDGVDGLG